MSRKTEKKYWDGRILADTDLYDQQVSSIKSSKKSEFKRAMNNYALYLLDSLVDLKFKIDKHLSVVEIGSAPGRNLIKFNNNYGYIPYGIEYAKSGVNINRRIFEENNISPDNVIHADFFNEEFHNKY